MHHSKHIRGLEAGIHIDRSNWTLHQLQSTRPPGYTVARCDSCHLDVPEVHPLEQAIQVLWIVGCYSLEEAVN